MGAITGKVWGTTTEIFKNPVTELHRLEVNRGTRCSTHKHEHKYNGFYVERGVLHIHVMKNDYALEDITILKAGDHMIVEPGEFHCFECPEAAIDGTESYSPTIAYEAYWPALLGKDIVRIDVGGKILPPCGTIFTRDSDETK